MNLSQHHQRVSQLLSSYYFVFSLEKFLSNEDVEKFRILDTLHLKNIAHINFIHNELGASLFLDNKNHREYVYLCDFSLVILLKSY